MSASLDKAPFFRLLLPLVSGILFQYFFYIHAWSIFILFAGVFFMLLSYLVPLFRKYEFRWIFGAGVCLFLFSVGILTTAYRQKQSSFAFPEEKAVYAGVITDVPQEKPKSIACKIRLDGSNKNIVCYFQRGVRSRHLEVGDRIEFSGKISPVKHVINPDDFDYPRYMYNKGISGYSFLYSDDWEKIGQSSFSFPVLALKCRQLALEFYGTLGFEGETLALLSALTLGYKDTLSDDIKQSFRATGTAHVLAVSGMHVAIIYGALMFLSGWFFRNRKQPKAMQVFLVLFIWFYAFLTGFSPSVIRASIMITVFCIAIMLRRKGITYNNIFIAAFFILCWNPFSFFDVGFQLSFAAVLSICFFQPFLSRLLSFKSGFLKAVWDLFTVSVAAQIGTFPLCLFYFGTFPVYFFITNLLVVPLVSVIFYLSIALFLLVLPSFVLPDGWRGLFLYLPVLALKVSVILLVGIIRFFENLPFAQIDNVNISFVQLVLLTLLAVVVFRFFVNRKSRMLMHALGLVFLFVFVQLFDTLIFAKNTLHIYSRNNISQMEWNVGKNVYTIDSIVSNRFIPLGNKNLLSVVSDEWQGKKTENRFAIDYLHIVKADSISLYSLTQTFSVRSVLLDRSLSGKNKRWIMRECEKLSIPYYDIGEKGIFRTNF